MKKKYRPLIIIALVIILIGGVMWALDHTVKKIEGFDDDILLGAFVIIAAIVGIVWLLRRVKTKKER